MNYSITHVTRFSYEAPITESVMEVRMQPINEGTQRCHRFELHTSPRARVHAYRDTWATSSTLRHPGRHSEAGGDGAVGGGDARHGRIPGALPLESWRAVDALDDSGEHWEHRVPGHFTQPTALLAELARASASTGASTRSPSCAGRRPPSSSGSTMCRRARASTRPSTRRCTRKGVCQDFTHVMIALVAAAPSLPLRQRLPVPRQRPPRPLEPTPPRTRGWRRGCRRSAGSASIPPTTSRRASATCEWPSAATTRTCRRPAACSRGRRQRAVGRGAGLPRGGLTPARAVPDLRAQLVASRPRRRSRAQQQQQ